MHLRYPLPSHISFERLLRQANNILSFSSRLNLLHFRSSEVVMAIKALVLIALAMVGVVKCQVGYELPVPDNAIVAPDLKAEESVVVEEQDPVAALAALIPGGGVPGEDYPILSSVPDTGFSCEEQEFPGYYADTADDAKCQVFHICQFDGRQDSFLCPNGTIFNQQYFVCDWWFNVDCSASEQFVRLNADIGKVMEAEADASIKNEVVAPGQLYGVPDVQDTPTPLPPPTTPSNLYSAPNRL
ncbi:uncharacterized protein [Palaemon carinicauda]|uniref:uncharacterized protein n=1 Tax=Palaemon carinicauda TaxID=392227 RepID=UPI0035B63A1E